MMMRMRQQNQLNGIMHEHSAGQDPSGLQQNNVKIKSPLTVQLMFH